jgi:hypothetical protein
LAGSSYSTSRFGGKKSSIEIDLTRVTGFATQFFILSSSIIYYSYYFMTMGKSAASNTYNAASSSGGGGAHSTSAASSFSSSHNNDPSDNKHEQRLQAVLLADTFSNAFHPITLEPYYPVDAAIIHTDDASKKGTSAATTTSISDRRPLILCPINNVPLLHHTINFLQGNGVEELLILVALGAEALEEYIRCHAEGSSSSSSGGGGGGGSGGGGMKSNASNYSGAIAWSSKLVISIVRITDCTNAGE